MGIGVPWSLLIDAVAKGIFVNMGGGICYSLKVFLLTNLASWSRLTNPVFSLLICSDSSTVRGEIFKTFAISFMLNPWADFLRISHCLEVSLTEPSWPWSEMWRAGNSSWGEGEIRGVWAAALSPRSSEFPPLCRIFFESIFRKQIATLLIEIKGKLV